MYLNMPILHYDYSAFCILFVIAFSMINRRVIKGHTNKLFFTVILLSIAATIAEIFSASAIFPTGLRCFMNYIFYLLNALIPVFYIIYVYASAGLSHHFYQNKKIHVTLAIPMVFFIGILIANLFTRCAFYFDENGNYVRGPFQIVLVAIIGIFNLMGIITIIWYHKILPVNKIVFLSGFFPIMMAAAITQQINANLSMTMFGLSISLLIISFSVQRHDENIDKMSGAKNLESAQEDFQKILATNQQVNVILLKIKNQNSIRQFLGSTAYTRFKRDFVTEMNMILKKFSYDFDVYYTHEGVYVISLDTADADSIARVADSLFKRFRLPFISENVSILVDTAMCTARFPDDLTTVDKLMSFRLKFDKILPSLPMVYKLSDFIDSKDFLVKNNITEIISKAISEKHFKMFYQPIYSIEHKKFISAEALIRLEDPEYGLISPAVFIPKAEQDGTIHEIGDFVFESVCKFIAEHNYKEFGLEYIELNLSVTQCMEIDLVQKMEYILQKYNVKPNQINLEITETAEGFDPYTMDKNIHLLSQDGFKFSLDDYGTGYSNIKRVTNLPLDIMKLDKSFVDEMKNPEMWAVIVNTVRMFKEMNKTILVEGVENEETFNALADLGCDYIQGFYFSRPLSEENFVKFLKEHNK